MAELYFPFNSVSGDREYTAPDFARYFADIISSGVSANGDNLPVTSSGDLNLSVGPGLAWIKGHLYYNTESKPLTIRMGDSNPRIDRVVVRLDVANRKIETIVVEGNPAAAPTPPALVRDDDYHDICLAEVEVGVSATQITQEDIVDTRTDNEVCGIIRTLIETLDVGDFMKNCQASFESWLANLKVQLDENAAGNLQNQIDDLKGEVDALSSKLQQDFDALAAAYRAEFDTLADNVQKEVVQIRTDLDNGVYSTPATIIVHTLANATVVMELQSAYLEDNANYKETQTADKDGYATFTTRTLGVYKITVTTTDSSTFTVEIDVKTVGIIEVPLMSFADMSWAEIDAVAQAGLAQQVFKVGDEKNILPSGTPSEAITVRIEAFDRDDLDGSTDKAPITIAMKNLLAGTYTMNSTSTNDGSWNSSVMRTSTIPTLLSQLPSDLRAVIKPVIKKTTSGSQSTAIQTTTDSLWLFSAKELGLQTTVAGYMDEGDTYPLYVSDVSRIKYLSNGSGAAESYWTRSPHTSTITRFSTVNAAGAWSSDYSNYEHGVCFGFCI